MTDDSEKKHIDKPPTRQPENPSGENFDSSDPLTINHHPSTTMEVHHHPDIHHREKKWKEYFLEFLMIFIAVTLGFFAEGLRERLNDHSKEREYMISLVEDLKSDQQILSQHITQMQSGITMMDSMITILNTPSMLAGNTGQLYYLARLAPRMMPLPNNDRTFEQLKNSGNFRLIKDISTSNRIMDYYQKFLLVRLLESINETEFTEYKRVAAKIFRPEIFVMSEGVNNVIKRVAGNPPLRTNDAELLQELSIFAVYMHGTKKGIVGSNEEIKAAGADLISYLNTAYHLINE